MCGKEAGEEQIKISTEEKRARTQNEETCESQPNWPLFCFVSAQAAVLHQAPSKTTPLATGLRASRHAAARSEQRAAPLAADPPHHADGRLAGHCCGLFPGGRLLFFFFLRFGGTLLPRCDGPSVPRPPRLRRGPALSLGFLPVCGQQDVVAGCKSTLPKNVAPCPVAGIPGSISGLLRLRAASQHERDPGRWRCALFAAATPAPPIATDRVQPSQNARWHHIKGQTIIPPPLPGRPKKTT